MISNLAIRSLILAAATSMTFAVSAEVADADDGGISFGGSPHLLKGHSSVAMRSEVVKMDIHDKIINVDCNFVFHNDGPTCAVRMGFPDQGVGAEEPYQGEPVPKGPGLKATFKSYDSYVDGKKVQTKLIPTDDRTLYWHEKTVTFKGGKDCLIRDVYTLAPGGQMTMENGFYHQTYYILHTGASWHGPIGNAKIIISIAPDAVKAPLSLKPLSSLPEKDLQRLKWSQLKDGTVLYEGPSKADLAERTIRFERANFRPDKKDDVHLYYGFQKVTNMK